MAEGVKERSFQKCSFKVTIPAITVLDGKAKVRFKIMSKSGIIADVILNEIYLIDKLGHKYDQYYMGIGKLKEQVNKDISVDVAITGKNFYMSDSALVLYFITSDGYKYEVSYTIKKESGVTLDYVMSRKLNDKELQRVETNILICKEKGIKKSAENRKSSQSNEDYTPSTESKISTIEVYKKALLREKYYIQNEGGRKHKLTNGIKIANKNGLYTYSFEMESELNLPDDAPITLMVGAKEAAGSVLVCEDFQIIVVVDNDFGLMVSKALMGVEPWKLLESLVKKLDDLNTSNKLALKLIQDGPGLASAEPIGTIPKGQAEAFNIAKENDITVIWGPPGTGKTYTMAQIATDALKKISLYLLFLIVMFL